MRAPEFWGAPAGLRARALAPLAALYGAAARARLNRRAPRADLPTIAIGGLTLGGDGKTPTALALAAMLKEAGERPFFATRGYGRRNSAEKEPFVVDPGRHDALDVGDEALLLARVAPTIVGLDRLASARLAATLGASVLLLDDGFHSRRLEPDLALLVVDADYFAGSGFCPPAGPLRAPLAAQFAHADVVLIIGANGAFPPVPHRTILQARLVGRPASAARLNGRRVFAFAGVGRPAKFLKTLKEMGAEVVGARWFPDHHPYRREELAALRREAGRLAALPITTEKDMARIAQPAPFEAAAVALSFENPALLKQILAAALVRQRVARKRGL